MTVLEEIAAERAKQIARGFTPEHDDKHHLGDLGLLAWEIMYHLSNEGHLCTSDGTWIEKAGSAIACNNTPRDCMVKAAALLVAELERRDRLPAVCPSSAHRLPSQGCT